jgi:hypothetical protein
MHTCKSLSTKLTLKQLKSWRGCSVDQRARTKPEASTSIPMNPAFQGPSQALNILDGTIQVVAGGTTRLKRKRTLAGKILGGIPYIDAPGVNSDILM